MKSRRTLVATIYLFVSWAISSPQDYFPINSQLPPVARISEPFSFVFSPSTFSSPYPISYSLANAPGWLSIDSSTRRLFGQPRDEDVPPGKVVGVPIELQAKDQSGTTTTNATLVVSRNPSPTVKIPLADQAQIFSPFSPPSSLLLHPSKPFAFTFDRNTFQADGASELNYYAVSGDNAPLPSWISFNPKNLSFTGITPPFESLVQPPQTFDAQLVASDVFGFASAPLKFSLVVGVHELILASPLVVLNATRGEPFEYKDLKETVKLDNRPIRSDEVKSITTSNLPNWLALNNETWELTGTPGPTANSSNITMVLQDTFFDTVNITLAINISTALFRQDITGLNITAGSSVLVDLKEFLWNPSDVDIELGSEPTDSWLELDSSSLTVAGTAPNVQHVLDSSVAVTAISRTTKHKETRNMPIHLTTGDAVPTTADSPTSIPTATPTTGANPEKPAVNAPLLAVLLPLLLILLIAAIIVFICLRRRNRRNEEEGRVLEVSAPIPGSFVRHDMGGPGNGLRHTMFDIGSSRRRRKRRSRNQGAATPNSGSAATSFTGSSQNSTHGHQTTQQLVTLRSSEEGSHTSEGDERRPGDTVLRQLRAPTVVRNGNSLLSDASIGEDDYGIDDRDSGSLIGGGTGHERLGNPYLDIPVIHEPFSIQSTPEIAYRGGSDYESSVELVREDVEDVGIALTGDRDSILSLRGMSQRVSRAWKQGTASKLLEEYKRKSYQSASSAQTARTSILATGIAAEKPVNVNVISRPTIIHIPSRPGEVRQISRRVDGSSPLFGGGSIANSPSRTLTPIAQSSAPSSAASTTDDIQRPPPALQTFTALSRDSDTSWDRIARDSLGIAYKDLKPPQVKPAGVFSKATAQEQDAPNWNNRNSKNLMSPDQWLRPKMDSTTEGPSLPKAAPRLSLYPNVMASPATQGSMTPSQSSSSTGSPDSARQRTTRHGLQGDRQLHVGRIRKQQQHAAAVAAATRPLPVVKSTTPSPTEWPRPTAAPPQRPLPETPTRPPLAERPNGAARGGAAQTQWAMARGRSNMSKRSNKTFASVRTNDTDDGWEDVRPDESSSFSGSSTNGSFPALI
ncbi:Axial budding pattern protein 2 [Apiospora arundinis]